MTVKRFSIILLMMLAAPTFSNAQKWRVRQEYRKHPPKVILVKLSTYVPQIDYFTNTHQPQKLQNIKKDADKVMQNMVQDFNTNFSFRPFYYFYDTNAHYIAEGRFDGVLLDKKLQPATNIRLVPGDTNFLIVCNSILMSEDHLNDRNKKTEVFAATDAILLSQPRLVVYDHHFNQMPRGTVRVADGGVRGGSKRKYKYVSRSFNNLSYFGKAKVLNNDFENFYGGSDFNK